MIRAVLFAATALLLAAGPACAETAFAEDVKARSASERGVYDKPGTGVGVIPLVGAAALVAAQPQPQPTASRTPTPRAGGLSVEPHVFATYDGRQHAAEMGRVWVPENRARRGSRLIQIGFVRLRSTAARPGPPIVWLAGGPGVPGIAMARVPVYFALFERLREAGDVILLDQRGLGESSPMSCEPSPTPADVFASERRWHAVFINKARDCALHWRRQGADLAGYTNKESADDIEDIRRALGAERISLVGHSYGTLLAETVIRRHGSRVERAILAAVAGPGDLIASPRQWDAMLARIGAAADPAEPELPSLFRLALARLARTPAQISVTDRQSASQRTITVGPVGLQWLVRHNMTDNRFYALLPALFRSIAAGDNALLAPRIEAAFNAFQGRAPMASAIDCGRGWTRDRYAAVQREARGALFSAVNLYLSPTLCAEMGVPRGNPAALSSSAGDMPVLFVSGDLDINTPASQAERLSRGFPRGTHLVIANSGHEMLPSREVQQIIVDFLRGEDVSRRSIRFQPIRFLSVEAAKQTPPATR